MLLNRHGQESDAAAKLLSSLSFEPTRTPMFVSERHFYTPPAARRWVGLLGTGTIYMAIAAGFFLTVRHHVAPTTPAVPLVVELVPLASPPETQPKKKEAPKPVEKKEKQPEPLKVPQIERTIVPITPVSQPVPVAISKSADPGLIEPETAAPKTQPAPPASKVSDNAPDTWEGKVLMRLNQYRRYPRSAMVRRQQGVALTRFVMDREGKVLSSRLERSSGFPDLDSEAVVLPKRAQPLPKPPDDVPGDTLELVVPVQFFLSVR